MKLTWDKKVIEECKNNLLGKKNITDEELFLVEFYENYLTDFYEELEEPNLNQKEVLKTLKDEVSNYKLLMTELPKKYKINLLLLMEGLKNDCFNEKERELIDINDTTPIKELVSLSYEVYNNISDKFNNVLSFIYNNNLVEVDKENEIDGPVCYCDTYNKMGFVYFPFYDDSSLTSCFNHELAHSIITNLNGDFYIDENYDLSEFHSIFMENYTDRYMYAKTKDNLYLASEYNSLDRFKEEIKALLIISSLSELKKFTKPEIIKKMNNDFNLDITNNFNNFFNNLLNGIDVNLSYLYLLGACCSINLLNKDDLKSVKEKFTKTCFNNITRRKDFFNLIGFYINNDYYMYDILDKEFKNKKELIRNIK